MKDIASIRFVFENVEVFDIDCKYIGDLELTNITSEASRISCNAIEEYRVAETFVIEVLSNANKKYKIEGLESSFDDWFHRIKEYNDLVDIKLNYEDGTSSEVRVRWGGNSDETNAYQKTFITEYGDLLLVVDDKKDIKDCFDLDEYNTKAHHDFSIGWYS